MTITTKLTGETFTYNKINDKKALAQFTEYLSRGMFTVESAEIIDMPADEVGPHLRYLLLNVRAFPGLYVADYAWDKETFPVTIDLEPEKEAD